MCISIYHLPHIFHKYLLMLDRSLAEFGASTRILTLKFLSLEEVIYGYSMFRISFLPAQACG